MLVTKVLVDCAAERKGVHLMTSVKGSKCPVPFSPLATSADRFYRIDRSQVSSFQLSYESELSLSQCTILVVSLIDFANENIKVFPDCRTVCPI